MIEIKNGSYYYKNKKKVNVGLNDINIKLPNCGFIYLEGSSGSGKTTLLNVISNKFNLDDGIINWSENISIGYLNQDSNYIGRYTVIENLEQVAELHSSEKKIETIIETIFKSNKNDIKTQKLSRGEKSLVGLSRILLMNTNVLLLDEPFEHVDKTHTIEILEHLKIISKEKLVIITSHNNKLLKKYASGHILMDKGKITTFNINSSDNSKLLVNKLDYQPQLNHKLFIKRHLFFFINKILIISLLFFVTIFSILVTFKKDVYDHIDFYQIQRKDGEYIANKDLIKIKNEYKYVTDYQYYYTYLTNLNDEIIKFIPISQFNKKNLIIGKMPNNDNEILLSKDNFKLYNKDVKYRLNGKVSSFKVVGISNDTNVISDYNFKITNFLNLTQKNIFGLYNNENEIIIKNNFFSNVINDESDKITIYLTSNDYKKINLDSNYMLLDKNTKTGLDVELKISDNNTYAEISSSLIETIMSNQDYREMITIQLKEKKDFEAFITNFSDFLVIDTNKNGKEGVFFLISFKIITVCFIIFIVLIFSKKIILVLNNERDRFSIDTHTVGYHMTNIIKHNDKLDLYIILTSFIINILIFLYLFKINFLKLYFNSVSIQSIIFIFILSFLVFYFENIKINKEIKKNMY